MHAILQYVLQAKRWTVVDISCCLPRTHYKSSQTPFRTFCGSGVADSISNSRVKHAHNTSKFMTQAKRLVPLPSRNLHSLKKRSIQIWGQEGSQQGRTKPAYRDQDTESQWEMEHKACSSYSWSPHYSPTFQMHAPVNAIDHFTQFQLVFLSFYLKRYNGHVLIKLKSFLWISS